MVPTKLRIVAPALQQPGHTDVLVEILPVQPGTAPAPFHPRTLLTSGMHEPRKIAEGDAKDSTIDEFQPESLTIAPAPSSRGLSRRNGHSTCSIT
jgi:hypothetical protein